MQPTHQEGGCRCGQVRFLVTGKPVVTMACHCTNCQHMTASAFSRSALYPSQALVLLSGEPVIAGVHGATRHFFCPHCMNWLLTRPDGMDHLVNVRATLLDDCRGYRPFIETFTSEKLPWAATPAVFSFERFPSWESFPGLLAEYAALPA